MNLLPLALFFILLAVLLLWYVSRQRKAAGFPGGRIIYADTSQWSPVEKPLYSASLGLTGKPDYLVHVGEYIVPVEVKSSHTGQSPYDSHVFQLTAYCILVEQAFGKRPPYGILHYPAGKNAARTFTIEFTPPLESAVRDTISQIQTITLRKGVDRSHASPARCARCGFRHACDQKL
jgi:CRISPR-associated exonuclease Cas4